MAARSMEEVAAYRQAREIHVEGQNVPKPVSTFDEASFPGGRATACTLAQKSQQLLFPADRSMQERLAC